MEQAGSSSFLERFCPGKRSQPLDHPLGREPTPLILGDHFAEVHFHRTSVRVCHFRLGIKGHRFWFIRAYTASRPRNSAISGLTRVQD